jgi:U3 small nucleolar RNA-associated protein 14
VQLAFAGPDVGADFLYYKDEQISTELGAAKTKQVKTSKAGWNDWAGPGLDNSKAKKSPHLLLNKRQREVEFTRSQRNDHQKPDIHISEKRLRSFAKYKVTEIPFPYITAEDYQRSLQFPVGGELITDRLVLLSYLSLDEWNASQVVRNLTQPEIVKRHGRIIEPAVVLQNYKSVPAVRNKKQKIQ